MPWRHCRSAGAAAFGRGRDAAAQGNHQDAPQGNRPADQGGGPGEQGDRRLPEEGGQGERAGRGHQGDRQEAVARESEPAQGEQDAGRDSGQGSGGDRRELLAAPCPRWSPVHDSPWAWAYAFNVFPSRRAVRRWSSQNRSRGRRSADRKVACAITYTLHTMPDGAPWQDRRRFGTTYFTRRLQGRLRNDFSSRVSRPLGVPTR